MSKSSVQLALFFMALTICNQLCTRQFKMKEFLQVVKIKSPLGVPAAAARRTCLETERYRYVYR